MRTPTLKELDAWIWTDSMTAEQSMEAAIKVFGKLVRQSMHGDAIKKAINECLTLLGADHTLMCLVGSWGDTLSDEDVLSGIERWRDLCQERREADLNHMATIYPGDAWTSIDETPSHLIEVEVEMTSGAVFTGRCINHKQWEWRYHGKWDKCTPKRWRHKRDASGTWPADLGSEVAKSMKAMKGKLP